MLKNKLAKFKDHLVPKKKLNLMVIVLDATHDVIKIEYEGRALQISPDKGELKKLMKLKTFEKAVNTMLFFIAEGIKRVIDKDLYKDLKKNNDKEKEWSNQRSSYASNGNNHH